MPVLALVALLAGIFAVSCGSSPGGGARQGEQPREENPGASDNPTLGSADAPVEMIEWGDFQ